MQATRSGVDVKVVARQGRGVAAVVVVLAVSMTSGCATVSSQTINTDTPSRSEELRQPPVAAPAVAASARVEGTSLVVTVAAKQQCEVQTLHYVHRVQDIKRTVAGGTITALALGGAALVGLGAWLYFDADGWAARATTTANGTSMPLPPSTYRTVGIGVAGASLIPFTIAVVDLFRSLDSHSDLGEVVATRDSRTEDCNQRPFAGEIVRPSIRGVAGARTSSEGAVRFSLLAVPADALPGEQIEVVAGEQKVTATLAGAEIASLRAALEADSTSAVAIEATRRREQACADGLLAASSLRIETVEDEAQGLRRWETTRQACGEHWTPQADAAKARFEQGVAKREAARQQRRCAAEFETAERELERGTRESALAAIDVANDACAGKANVASLRARLDELVKKQEREASLAVQRQALIDALRRGQPDVALRIVRQNRELCQPPPNQDRVVLEAIFAAVGQSGDLVLQGDTSTKTATSLCFARTAVVECAGSVTWRDFTAGLARRVAATDPLRVSKVVKALNSGTCVATGAK